MVSKLAPHQITQIVYDPSSESIKTSIQNMEIAIELDADDGDSVETRLPLLSDSVNVGTDANNNDILITVDVRYFSEFLIAAYTTQAITASGLQLQVEVSPSDTDNVWHHEPELDVTPLNHETGFKHTNKIGIGPWRRARVKIKHNGFSSGAFTLYANGR